MQTGEEENQKGREASNFSEHKEGAQVVGDGGRTQRLLIRSHVGPFQGYFCLEPHTSAGKLPCSEKQESKYLISHFG